MEFPTIDDFSSSNSLDVLNINKKVVSKTIGKIKFIGLDKSSNFKFDFENCKKTHCFIKIELNVLHKLFV